MRILIIDNYDSFTYNLRHYVEQFAEDVTVVRNDAITLDEAARYTHYIISPGPGLPVDAGITMPLIERFNQSKPILGVCLGCQAIAEFLGGTLYNQQLVAHGIMRQVVQKSTNSILLKDLPPTFDVGLYHSWAITEASLPKEIAVTAKTTNGVVMTIEHTQLPLYGVQFHPESIMTKDGLSIIKNWLQITLYTGINRLNFRDLPEAF